MHPTDIVKGLQKELRELQERWSTAFPGNAAMTTQVTLRRRRLRDERMTTEAIQKQLHRKLGRQQIAIGILIQLKRKGNRSGKEAKADLWE